MVRGASVKIGYLMQEGVDIMRPPFDGPANHVREVIGALSRRGHQVSGLVRVGGRVWTSNGLADFRPVVVPRHDRGALRLFESAARRVQSELQLPYLALFESLRFAQACVQELRDCDLLYERLTWVSYGGGLAARRLDVPLVLEDNGDALFDLEAKGIAPSGLQRRFSLSLMRRAVVRAAHVVSTGAGWREQFIRRWSYDPGKVTTIENGTVLVHLLAREDLRSFGDGAAGEPLTLAYVGGFHPWHGMPVLLTALSRARARGVRARLVMIGSGDGLDATRALATRLDLDRDLTFTGQLEPSRYAPLLARADIGVSPYSGWPEFSGLKVLDYKAAGLPTIASGIDGHPLTLRSGHTGVIVPPGDVEALSQAIVDLAGNQALCRQMGRAARLEAETTHRWEHTAEKLERLLEREVSAAAPT